MATGSASEEDKDSGSTHTDGSIEHKKVFCQTQAELAWASVSQFIHTHATATNKFQVHDLVAHKRFLDVQPDGTFSLRHISESAFRNSRKYPKVHFKVDQADVSMHLQTTKKLERETRKFFVGRSHRAGRSKSVECSESKKNPKPNTDVETKKIDLAALCGEVLNEDSVWLTQVELPVDLPEGQGKVQHRKWEKLDVLGSYRLRLHPQWCHDLRQDVYNVVDFQSGILQLDPGQNQAHLHLPLHHAGLQVRRHEEGAPEVQTKVRPESRSTIPAVTATTTGVTPTATSTSHSQMLLEKALHHLQVYKNNITAGKQVKHRRCKRLANAFNRYRYRDTKELLVPLEKGRTDVPLALQKKNTARCQMGCPLIEVSSRCGKEIPKNDTVVGGTDAGVRTFLTVYVANNGLVFHIGRSAAERMLRVSKKIDSWKSKMQHMVNEQVNQNPQSAVGTLKQRKDIESECRKNLQTENSDYRKLQSQVDAAWKRLKAEQKLLHREGASVVAALNVPVHQRMTKSTIRQWKNQQGKSTKRKLDLLGHCGFEQALERAFNDPTTAAQGVVPVDESGTTKLCPSCHRRNYNMGKGTVFRCPYKDCDWHQKRFRRDDKSGTKWFSPLS